MSTEETYYTMSDNHGGLHAFPASELPDWPERKKQIDEAWERWDRGEFTAEERLKLTRLIGLEERSDADGAGEVIDLVPPVEAI